MLHADVAPTRRELVTKASALALLGSTAPARAAALSDTDLLQLGAQLDLAWADEIAASEDQGISDEVFDTAVARSSAIVAKIENLQATTLEGLIVKARACSWCFSGEPFEHDSFDDGSTTDLRLAASVLRDLIEIGGKHARTG